MRLLDVFLNDYDVVVMNPPYGHGLDENKSLVKELYPDTCNDLYCMFVERGLDLVQKTKGYLGALTSRTFIRLTTFQKFRERVLLDTNSVLALADLGWGILDDALNETAGYIVAPSHTCSSATFFRLNDEEYKERSFQEALAELQVAKKHSVVSVASPSEFHLLPGSPLCYWTTEKLRRKFSRLPKLYPRFAYVGQGTSHPRFFCRYHWEVHRVAIGRERKWAGYANGGPPSLCYRDIEKVSDWEDNGRRPKAEVCRRYPYLKGNYGFVVQSEDYYFLEGITYGKRSEYFSVQHLPAGSIFSSEGQSIFPINSEDVWPFLGLLNGAPVCYFLLLTAGVHKERMYVRRVPIPELNDSERDRLALLAHKAHDLKAAWDTGNEICTRFSTPWLLQLTHPQSDAFTQGLGRVLELLGDDAPPTPTPPHPHTLSNLLDRARAIENATDAHLQALQAQIDEAVYNLYEISPADRALIERELGDRPPELVWPQLERKPDEEKRREHVRRFFSYYARRAVREDEDGIVPLAGCAAREPYLVDRVRAQLEAQFGPAVAYQLEQDGAAYLGRPVEEWLRRYFFARLHVKLYKKRPILWHLTSPRRYFAVLVDYHRLTRDTLPKVQTLYLWPQMEEVRTRLAAARAGQVLVRASVKAIADLEDELADLEETERRLAQVIDSGYNPDIDDGVRANLLPLQEAGLLPVKRVV